MSVNRPFVSILMNCYNSDSYLREALESVLAQSFTDWELIFWDNQSTDRSAEIFKSYTDSRFRYFFAPSHTGLGEARHLAMAQTRGEWIAFLDCDDLWLPEKLEKQVRIIEEEKSNGGAVGLVYGRCRILTSKGEGGEWGRRYVGKKLPEGWVLEAMLMEENFITIPSALVSREAYFEFGPAARTYRQAEDYCLFAGVSSRYRVKAVQETCCLYRVHDENLSKRQRTLEVEENIQVFEQWSPFLPVHVNDRQKERRLKALHSTAGILMIAFDGKFNEGLKRIRDESSLVAFGGVVIRKILFEFSCIFSLRKYFPIKSF